LPGLLAAGVGALVFTGLDSLTGFGTFSLVIPNLPKAGTPTLAELGWAVAVGLVAAPTTVAVKWSAVWLLGWVRRRLVLATVLVGAAIAGLSIAYAEATSHSSSDVLFSGQSALPGLVSNAAGYSAGALVLLVAFKGLAYAAALSAFRGGPTFPALFIGAAGGMALSHLPGLGLVPGIAIGMSAMTASMLRLPMTGVLVTTLFLGTDSFPVIPLSIVAVAVSYVASAWLSPPTPSVPEQAGPAPASTHASARVSRT
jgi:hypothetical protein